MAGTRRRPGRMGPFIESYREALLERGYTPMTVRGLLRHVGALGRWMATNDVETADLDVVMLEELLAHRQAVGRAQVRTTKSMGSLLDHLRELGVVAPEKSTPVDPLLAEYRGWMVEDRGLAPLTVLRYENLAVRSLVTDVGETLAGWLQRRPVIESRRVFLTTKAPIGDIRPALVSETLRRVCLRCRVEVIGAHRLRHGLATDMLQRGASLVEVGQAPSATGSWRPPRSTPRSTSTTFAAWRSGGRERRRDCARRSRR